jgi:hypothetical protein
MAKDKTVTCEAHPGRHLAYIACTHVVQNGAATAHFREAKPDDPGEMLCLACASRLKTLTADDLILICGHCAEKFFTGSMPTIN